MRVTVNANVLTLVTTLPVEMLQRKGVCTIEDDKRNVVYTVRQSDTEEGAISIFGLKTNAVIDGCAAVVIIEPVGTTEDDMKFKYGKALLAAKKYIDAICAEAHAETEAVNAIFANEE